MAPASRLLDILLSETPQDAAQKRALLRALAAVAGAQEMDLLVDYLLEHPHSNLGLELLRRCGTKQQALSLWKGWRGEVPVGGFSLLGVFGISEAGPSAWRALQSGDWGRQCEVVFALLGMDCAGINTEILEALDEAEGKPLFWEPLPALAPKVAWPNAGERLFRWGESCSSDCLGGIVLGLGLAGEQELFERMLLRPDRELFCGGTGNRYWSWCAARSLGLGIEWVSARIRDCREKHREILFRTLFAWVALRLCWLSDDLAQLPPPSSLLTLHQTVFQWGPNPNRDASLRKLCPKELLEDYYALEKRVQDSLPLHYLTAVK